MPESGLDSDMRHVRSTADAESGRAIELLGTSGRVGVGVRDSEVAAR